MTLERGCGFATAMPVYDDFENQFHRFTMSARTGRWFTRCETMKLHQSRILISFTGLLCQLAGIEKFLARVRVGVNKKGGGAAEM